MQRSTLGLAAVVLLLGLGALLWFSTQTNGERGRAEDLLLSERPVAGEPDAAEPALAPVEAPDEAAAEEDRDTLETNARRASTTPAEAAQPVLPVLKVRVVDGVDGSPVAGARVFARFLTSQSVPLAAGSSQRIRQEDVDRWDGASLDAIVAEQTARRTDEEGLVTVPAPIGGSTIVVARHGDRWGRRVLDEREPLDGVELESQEPEELELHPDRALVVRAIDGRGQPVGGVPIQVQYFRWSNWQERREVSTERGTGEARFEHLQLNLSDAEEHERWRVTAAVLVPDPPRRELDPRNLPGEPVVLEVVRGGSVVVSVFDPTGAPLEEGGTLSLGLVEDGQSRRMSAFNSDERRVVQRPVRGPRTLFEHVAPGYELDVAYHPDEGRLLTHVFVPGPARASETTRVALTVGQDHPIVRLRILDAEGIPLAGESLDVRRNNRQVTFGGAGKETLTTDGGGFLFVGLDAGWKTGRLSIDLGEELSGALELDRAFPNGLTELGDLVLIPTPLIVSGRVLGPGGVAIADAEVELSRTEEEDWDRRREHDTTTDAAGAFEMRGLVEPGSYRLTVTSPGYGKEKLEFALGSPGVLVELSPAGSIVGHVLLDEGMPVDDLDVRVSPADEDSVELDWEARRADVEEDGSFLCSPLPPGVYDLTLSQGWDNLLHEVQGIVVDASFGLRDPVPTTIDLRGRLHAFHVTVVTPGDGEDRSGTVRFGPAGSGELDESQWFHGDEVALVTRYPSIDLDVQVAGFRVASRRGVTGDQRVELEPGFPVRVVLLGDASPFSAPYALSVGLTPLEGDRGQMDWGAPRFDERGEIVLQATASGPMRVTWILEVSEAGSAMAMSADPDPEQIVHLVEGGAEQRVEVRLTREESERLMKQLTD